MYSREIEIIWLGAVVVELNGQGVGIGVIMMEGWRLQIEMI